MTTTFRVRNGCSQQMYRPGMSFEDAERGFVVGRRDSLMDDQALGVEADRGGGDGASRTHHHQATSRDSAKHHA